ncbi:MAG: SusC/RagA family TonB-linked outer membrane protein [Flavisolibacter sp.]
MSFKNCLTGTKGISAKNLIVVNLTAMLLFLVAFQASAYDGHSPLANLYKLKNPNKRERVNAQVNKEKLDGVDKVLTGAPVPLPIKGKVTDENGNPVVGASVVVKGTKEGTTTNDIGEFELSVNAKNIVLVVSHIGMETQTISVKSESYVTVSLKPAVDLQREVVVIGYGTQKKATLTGAISSIKGEQIVTTKNESILNTLSGKIPGVIVVQNTAEPGSYSNVFNIRGLGNPLIVIDGIAQENQSAFMRLNPNDIENISVLKDASAAVYGFRSANGVVLVTTKQGKTGKFSLEYSGLYGFQQQSGVPPVLGPADFMQLENEFNQHGGYTSGMVRTYSQAQMDEYRNGSKQGTDWIDLTMAKNAPQSQHTISATGGTDKIKFYSSFSHLNQDGLFKNNSLTYKRYSLTNNIEAKLSQAVKVNFNLSGSIDNKNSPYSDVSTFFNEVWNMNPLQTPYLTNTTQYPSQSWLDIKYNPLLLMDPNTVGFKKNDNLFLNSLFTIAYDAPFLPGLQFSATGSYDYWNNNNTLFKKQYNLYLDTTARSLANPSIMNSPSTIQRQFYEFKSWMTRVQAEYKKSFNGNNVSALVLAEQSERKGDNFSSQRDLIIALPLLAAGLSNSNQQGTMDAGSGTTLYPYDYVNRAYVGRLAYDYNTKYLAEFSFRYDGSSKFINNNQWGFFPNASIGWRIDQEKFFKNSKFLSAVDNLKLRGSYGILGDDGALVYQYLTGYNYPASTNVSPDNIPAGAVFDGAFIPSSQNRGIANPNITWYTSKMMDAGLDYSMWHGKLGITFDFFVRNRSGLLATPAGAIPGVVGASMPQMNLNSDQTHGFELAFSHHSVIGKFILDATLNASYTRTYFKTRGDQTPQTNSYNNWLYNRNNRVSDVVFILKGQGQYQNWDQILNSPWWVSNNTLPGDPYFQDISGSGQQSTNGYVYNNSTFLINANGAFPLMNFGSTVHLGYQNFDLALVWQGSTLRYTQLPTDFTRFSIGTNYGNGITDFLNRWHPIDPNADPYNPTTQYVSGKYPFTGFTIPTNTTLGFQNASYLRLKSIELGYSLPTSLLKKMGLQGTRLFVNGYNLFTLSYMPNYQDPEHPGARGEGSGYAYPLNKVVNFGIDVRF